MGTRLQWPEQHRESEALRRDPLLGHLMEVAWVGVEQNQGEFPMIREPWASSQVEQQEPVKWERLGMQQRERDGVDGGAIYKEERTYNKNILHLGNHPLTTSYAQMVKKNLVLYFCF